MNHPDTDPFAGEIFSKCYLDSSDGLWDRTQSILQSKVLVQKVGGVIKLLYRYIFYGQLFRKELLPPYNLIRCVSCTTSYHLNALCILCQTGNYSKTSKQAWHFSFHYCCFEKHNYVVRQGNLFSLLVCFCCLKLKRSHRLEKENTRLTLRQTTVGAAENIFLE